MRAESFRTKNFKKQINIYKTFKFSFYRLSSLLLYKKIIKVAFLLKTLKENIEYITPEQEEILKEKLRSFKELHLYNMSFNKDSFVLGVTSTIVDLIIDTDMQPIYEIFKKLDRIKDTNSYLNEKKEFIIKLFDLEEFLQELMEFIPKEKSKKAKRFTKFVEEVNV